MTLQNQNKYIDLGHLRNTMTSLEVQKSGLSQASHRICQHSASWILTVPCYEILSAFSDTSRDGYFGFWSADVSEAGA